MVDGGKLNSESQKQILGMDEDIRYATKKTLNALKFFFNWEDMEETLFSIKGTYWSLDHKEWNLAPRIISTIVKAKNVTNLTEDTLRYIQNYLDEKGWEPFLALRHLHKAKIESIRDLNGLMLQ